MSVDTEPGQAVLTVADTGIGIPQELKAGLFEPYTTSGRAGTDNEKSIGLGLSIVKKFVELHGGKISCESAEGNGTTFFIRLPAHHG